MAAVCIVKNEQGKLEGFGQRGERAYNRFLRDTRNLGVGEIIWFSYKAPRSPAFHRRHFWILNTVFNAQERFDCDYKFRKWTEVGAGYCDLLPGHDGQLVAVPRSIDYETLDDVEFRDVHVAVVAFLRGEHARRFLWPHLSDEQTWEMLEALSMEWDARA